MENFENENYESVEETEKEVDEELKNEPTVTEETENISEEYIEPQYSEESQIGEEYGNPYNLNKITMPPVYPIKDYKPMSKGLKVFAALMALIIAMTGSCAVGYFFGKKGNAGSAFKKISVSLSAKPKNTDENTAAEVYEKVNKSVVGITIYNKSGSASQASGVIYSKDGYVVTNDHIYADVPAAKFKIYDYSGKEYDADFVAGDSISDLSLLKIKNGSGFTVPDFGNSDELIFGENVVAIGRPSDARSDSSITKGIISHKKRRMQTTSNYSATLIQTDSAINPGSSGGALVNMYGQIVGITSSKLAGVDYDSMGFAIPTTTMKRVVSQLAESGKVKDRAKLGITYQEITSVTKEIKEYKAVGLYIASVAEDSDLYGKVNKGDIITKINNKDITRSDDVLDVIEDSRAGDEITITILDAKGKTNDYKVKLRANICESSYTLSEKGFSENETPKTPNSDGGNGGGTFNFPDGE